MIHLKPLSANHSLNWIYNGSQPCKDADETYEYTLENYSLSSFSVFISILTAFKSNASERLRKEIDLLQENILKNIDITKNSLDESKTGFLASSVTYAIMRRISRESAYTASVIDKGAKLFNDLLSENKHTRVIIRNIDYADKLSLKIFGRAILINAFAIEWNWIFINDPINNCNQHECLFDKIRYQFFLKLQPVLQPELKLIQPASEKSFRSPVYLENQEDINLFSISKELVLQNYDWCVWAADYLIQTCSENETIAEAYRLSGLALINFGLIDEACLQFQNAEKTTENNYKKAHISYLLGLSATKRHYQLTESEVHYRRGLTYLEAMENKDANAEALERAWIYNGMAMNQVLRNKGKQTGEYKEIVDKLLSAFNLVKSGNDAARGYLRFNLLANMAFLMEIYSNYTQAIQLFKRTFDSELYEATNDKARWDFVLNYRIGLLHYKAGNQDAADALFEKILNELSPDSIGWYMYERLCRGAGFIKFNKGDAQGALTIFKQGLRTSVNERSYEGARYHGKGAISCYYRLGETEKCVQLYAYLQQEGVRIAENTAHLFSSMEQQDFMDTPSPKLPAYVPELDFEDIPKVDINQYMATSSYSKSRTGIW